MVALVNALGSLLLGEDGVCHGKLVELLTAAQDNTPKSKPSSNKGANAHNDFTSALIDNNKKALTKKNTHLGITFDNFEDDNIPKLPPIYVTPEHEVELLYSDLL